MNKLLYNTIFLTPNKKWKIYFMILADVILRFLSEVNYYYNNLKLGVYPTDADSIAIPISQFLLGILITLPICCLILWFFLKDYKGKIELFVYKKTKSSFFWTFLFVILILSVISSELYIGIIQNDILLIASSLFLIWLLLVVRAVIISRY